MGRSRAVGHGRQTDSEMKIIAEDRARGPRVGIAFPPRFPLDRDQEEGRFRMHNACGSRTARAGHVKVAHHAEIRNQVSADQFDRSARVEALGWRATRSGSPNAGRDRPGRTLPVVSRSILTFSVRFLPNGLVIRDGAPGCALDRRPPGQDMRRLSGTSRYLPPQATRHHSVRHQPSRPSPHR